MNGMYMILGFGSAMLSFLLLLNRKAFPAALALAVLAFMLFAGAVTRHG